MVHNAITKHIVTAGDYNLVPRDQALFDCPDCEGDGSKFFNVAPGQLVAYTISATTLQPVTVDSTDIAALTGHLYIGVGVDTDGDGAADDVRLLAGERLENCLLDEVSVSAPVCGQPQILAAYLDCVKCWENYTVNFRYSDQQTRSYGLTRADQEEITVSFSTDCSSCDDCPATANCEEVICKMVDGLNQEFDLTINQNGVSLPYPDRKQDVRPKPYRAVRLHEYWRVFCLTPDAVSCDCDNCDTVPVITGIRLGGDIYDITGNLNPADNTQTFIGQLKNVAQQIECHINTVVGPKTGFAFVAGGGPDSCCPIQLHVVSCSEDFQLLGESNAEIDVCDAIEPYPGFANTSTCVNCGDSPLADTVPTCGLAVIIEQPDVDCGCYVTKPLAFYGRVGELSFIKDIDSFAPVLKATELLAPRLPENFGAWIQWLEYAQETGGRGRQYRDVNAQQGFLGEPDAVSRAKNGPMFANCSKSYCTYFLGHNMERKSLTKSIAYNRLSSFIHIPSDDFNTLLDWETLFNAVLTKGASTCKVLGSVSCVQIPGTPTYTPTYVPTYSPTYAPSYSPTYTPTYTPT